MKKLKKLVVAVLAMTMMLAMSVTAFAAPEGPSITVKNADNATLTIAQVIKADTKTTTGWAFCDAESANVFMDGFNAADEQAAIEAYMNATEAERSAVIAKISTSVEFTNGSSVNGGAGIYVINATEENFQYQTMAAYIGMDVVGNATTLKSAELNAKKEPIKIGKTIDEENKQVEIDDEIKYTVTATVPYIPEGKKVEGIRFAVNDSITGGEYKLNNNKKLDVKVTLGNTVVAGITEVAVNDNAFQLDLSELATADNKNANVQVTIEYTAIAKELVISNKAYPTVCGHDYDDESNWTVVTSYTGSLTITKVDENDTKLADATFVVINEDEQYAKFDDNKKLIGWTDDLEDASTIITGTDGTATVYGFDSDKTYSFVEIDAPTGYTTNSDPVVAEWKADAPEDAQAAFATKVDTKLIELPFTGGMGTTIFTVLGVVVMVVAAGLFFATRKKASK